MPEVDRRRFLQLTGGSAALSVLTPSIARAASIPANRRTGSLDDVEHIVVLMQENRSFDHYFGTMKGVRGYGEPHPAELPNGKAVWRQPHGKKEVLPFRPDLEDLGLAFLQDLDHEWESGHEAFNAGRYDRWIAAKDGATTMAHLRRSDVPFHYALADAFTVCDSYHCSMLGPTNPNRYYLWTGWVGNDGKGGGPVVGNGVTPAFDWTTYPERLQKAGVSWKIYQDTGNGIDAAHAWGWTILDPYIGNYGDNALLYFKNVPGRDVRPALRRRPDGHRGQDRGRRRVLRPAPERRHGGHPAPGHVDRRARGVHRAPELARELRRLVRLEGARRPHQQSRRLGQDGPLPDLRRERRVLRPRGAAVPQRRRAERRLDGAARPRAVPRPEREARALRTGRAGPDDGDLALEHGRLGVLRGLRPHLDHPVHGEAVRRA